MTTQPQSYAGIILVRIAARQAAQAQQATTEEPVPFRQAILQASQQVGQPPALPAPSSTPAQPQLPLAQRINARIQEKIAPVLAPILNIPTGPRIGQFQPTIGGGLGAITELLTTGVREVGGKILSPPLPVSPERDIGKQFRENRLPSPYQGLLEAGLTAAIPLPGQAGKALAAKPAAKAPIALPASAKPMPSAIAAAGEKSAVQVAQNRPGAVSAFFDHIPVVHGSRRILRPGLDIPEHILVGHNAEGSVMSEIRQASDLVNTQTALEAASLFGKEAVAGRPTAIPFLGTAAEVYPGYQGTLLDMAGRPHLYQLTPEQIAFLPRVQKLFEGLVDETNVGYGTDIGKFQPAPGGWFLSNVDSSEAALEVFGGDLMQAARSGGAATRVFGTAFEHWKAKPDFKPVTDLNILLMRQSETRARLAGRETFRWLSGGKTKIEVLEETHPELVSAKKLATQRITNLRGQLETASRVQSLQRVAARGELAAAKAAQHRAEPMLKQIEALGEEYGPELSYLSGQVRELHASAAKLTKEGVEAYNRSVIAGVKRRDITTELNALAPALDKLRRLYEAADTRPYVLVQEGLFRYYPVAEAEVVRTVRKQSDNAVVNFLQSATATKLSADFSPMLGIQTPVGFLLDPVTVVRSWIAQNPLRAWNREQFTELLARDPKSWQEYSFYMQRDITLGTTPTEFAGGFLGKLGGIQGDSLFVKALREFGKRFSEWTNALYIMVEIQGKGVWDIYVARNLRAGMSEAAAKASAADTVGKVYPHLAWRQAGLSPRQATALRAATTSISFATKPAELMLDGARGLVKLGTGQALTAQERVGMGLVIRLAASTNMLSVMSSVITATARGTDVEEAIKEALDPTNRHHMALTIGDVTIPLGGPFRGVIKAVVPREVEGSPVPIPFAGIPQWLKSRGQPQVMAGIDLVKNKDFYGNRIYGSTFPWNIAMMLEYGAESIIPLAAVQPLAGLRAGQTPKQILEQTGGQFAGVNIQENTVYQERDLVVQRWSGGQGKQAKGWADLAPSEQRDFTLTFPQVASELRQYQERQAKNGVDWAVRKKQLLDLEDDRLHSEEGLVQEFTAREISADEFRDAYSSIQDRIVTAKKQVDKDFQLYRDSGQRPEDPDKAALFDYYNLYDESRTASGRLDWDVFTEKLTKLQGSWTAETQKYVEQNTNLAGHPPLIQEYLDGKRRWRNYWEAGDLILAAIGKSEMVGIFAQYKAAPTDVQREIDAQTGGLLRQVKRAEERARALARRENPDLDAYLLRFGYVGAAGHRSNVGRQAMIRELNTPLADIMAVSA